MIKKKFRLTWKDINYIVKKQKIISGQVFSFLFFNQYPNRIHNQYSIQVPVKVSKHTVQRNYIKRLILEYISKNNLIEKKIWKNYYKIFVITNKKSIPLIKNTIETKDKKLIREYITNSFEKSFNNLTYKLWNQW